MGDDGGVANHERTKQERNDLHALLPRLSVTPPVVCICVSDCVRIMVVTWPTRSTTRGVVLLSGFLSTAVLVL